MRQDDLGIPFSSFTRPLKKFGKRRAPSTRKFAVSFKGRFKLTEVFIWDWEVGISRLFNKLSEEPARRVANI